MGGQLLEAPWQATDAVFGKRDRNITKPDHFPTLTKSLFVKNNNKYTKEDSHLNGVSIPFETNHFEDNKYTFDFTYSFSLLKARCARTIGISVV